MKGVPVGSPRDGAPSAKPALRVEALEQSFGERLVLERVSFEVASGERLVIVGASGAGKTTLLRAIAGLTPPVSGRIEIDSREAAALPPERRNAVYLHQVPLLFPHLNVFENVAFPLRVRRVAPPEIARRVQEALASVQLAGFEARRPRQLSGGQRSRAALARAIVARPSLLLLDEPLAGLDVTLREEVREAIVQIVVEYRPGLVLVTHDLDEAGVLADRIGVLLSGRLVQVAAPEELFARPASLAVARFLGIPNEVSGWLRGDGTFESVLGVHPVQNGLVLEPPGGADTFREVLQRRDREAQSGARGGAARDGRPAVAVFRAEAVRLTPEGALPVHVTRILHRAQSVAARARLGDLEIEIAVDRLAPPAVGAQVAIELDPRRLTVFAPE